MRWLFEKFRRKEPRMNPEEMYTAVEKLAADFGTQVDSEELFRKYNTQRALSRISKKLGAQYPIDMRRGPKGWGLSEQLRSFSEKTSTNCRLTCAIAAVYLKGLNRFDSVELCYPPDPFMDLHSGVIVHEGLSTFEIEFADFDKFRVLPDTELDSKYITARYPVTPDGLSAYEDYVINR